MRELTVDFNSENPLAEGAEAGYIGENNATKLIVKPSAEMLQSGSSFLVVVFLSKGDVYRSEHFVPADELEIMLGAHLTRDHYLSLQLEGYSEEDLLVCKSPMISKIHFMPSISGSESEIDADDFLLGTQVTLNTNARHSHANSDVLNGMGESGGQLTYNGIPVCDGGIERTVVLSVESGEVDSLLSTSNNNIMSIISYKSAEDFAVPMDAEIKSVELNIEKDDCPEWVDLRDMFVYDEENPYILGCHKPFLDESSGLIAVCKVFFLGQINKFAKYISAFWLKNVRITYIEKTIAEQT